MKEIRPATDLVQKLTTEDIEIPSMPEVATKVLAVIENDNFSINQLEDVMLEDQSITANLLKIANTPFYNRGKPITTINGAFMSLGINNVVPLISMIALNNYARSRHINNELLQHPHAVSILTSLLASSMDVVKKEEALIAGLLHDMGILLLFDNAPAAYVQIGTKIKEGKHSYIEIERELLGCDHCQIGGILAEKWHFPSIYAYTIMHHHDEEIISGDLTYEQKLCYLVGIADRIAFEADIGIGESDKKCLQSLIESLDIENHTYEHAVDKSRFFKKTGKWR